MRFIAIGLVAGFFSALFGVGGGIVVVPLLILAAGFGQRTAAATSLASIGLIALAGTVSYALYGNVRWRAALFVGLAAVGGVELGVLTAKSISEDALQRLFGVLLLVVAVQLVLRARRISSAP